MVFTTQTSDAGNRSVTPYPLPSRTDLRSFLTDRTPSGVILSHYFVHPKKRVWLSIYYLMKYIITESQFNLLHEQHPFAVGGVPEWYKDSVNSFNKNYPTLSNFMLDMSLWAIPYVGPYIVTTKNTIEGIRLYKEGKKVEGIISLLTSPLALMKVVKVLKAMGSSSDMVRMVQTINKTGIPLLVSKGQEAFLNWGYKTFGDDFARFIKFIKNETQIKPILDDLLSQIK